MKHYTIRRGERPSSDALPAGSIEDVEGVTTVAVLGEDWPGLRPHMEVEIGAHVVRGQKIFTNRAQRNVCFVSPVAGVVERLTFGARRTLGSLVIRVEPEGAVVPHKPDEYAQNSPRDTLLKSGFWPAFRARPFGCMPAPEATPQAIIVNAVRATPQSPDPATVLAGSVEDFRLGCIILTKLLTGQVHICQSPGAPLGPDHERIRQASFSGTAAAGLVGTQIDRLCRGMSVWSVGYQDVAAIGHFFVTGVYLSDRVVSITGPMASPPRLLRLPIGARIADVINAAPPHFVDGPLGSGGEIKFLGRFDERIRLLSMAVSKRRRLFQAYAAGHSAAVPSRALETSVAIDVLLIPLLRALSIGDAETAKRLGCLGLLEEDIAAATRRCTSGIDYASCLRGVLSELMAEGV